MKLSLFVLSVTVLAASCNTNPKASESTVEKTDTTLVTEIKTSTTVKEKQITPASNATTSNSESINSETNNMAKEKTGWSKTAKGAVIGGVAGAGTGAIINKKNRVKGAVVGGVIGAGTGAIIGNELDKKDGRH